MNMIAIVNINKIIIIFSLILNIVLMLIITLVIAALTLIERKLLSLLQRRVGPYYVGYKGRLQYLADALKLLAKGFLVPHETNKLYFYSIPSLVAGICYSFWVNSLWGPSIAVLELEYNIVYSTLLSTLFCLCIMLTGFISKSKYAFLASIRSAVMSINLEIFLGLFFLNITIFSESFSFSSFVYLQESVWLFFLFFLCSGIILITFLLEVNRAPFDLAEAESELIAGYSVEYGAFSFALYYLGEYFHLFFFSLVISILLLGGWQIPKFFIYLNEFKV